MPTMNNCLDCGKPTSGLRCKTCHGADQRKVAAQHAEESDRDVLQWVDVEKLTVAQVAARLGVSRVSASKRINKARSRQAFLRQVV